MAARAHWFDDEEAPAAADAPDGGGRRSPTIPSRPLRPRRLRAVSLRAEAMSSDREADRT